MKGFGLGCGVPKNGPLVIKNLEEGNTYLHRIKNKTRTSKIGAISKAQKAQNIFWKKIEIFEIFFFQKSRIVPKNVKGGPFWIY